jgi:hypothetical protein
MSKTELIRTFALVAGMSPFAWGQQLDLSFLDRLSDKTDEVVTVTLGQDLLKMASGLLANDKDPEARGVKEAVSGLQQILVRSYKFKKDGEYSPSDVDRIYAQMKGPGWSQILEAREKTERTTIHLKTAGNSMGGMIIVAASPRELTVVSLLGNIDMEKLGKLSGNFGIPEVKDSKKTGGEKSTKAPAKEEEDDNL